jgi:hypothetical protein
MATDTDVFDNQRSPADNGPVVRDAQTNGSSSPAVDADAPTAAPADAASEPSTEAAAAGVEPDVLRAQLFHELAEFIRDCTAPPVLVGKWDFLGEQNSLLRIDMLPIEFVEVLAQNYSSEAVAELGLYERVDGELRLPSCLEGDAPLYVAIDEANRKLRFSRGNNLLFPLTRTAADHALERIPPDSTQATDTLFIADSQDAVEVMQQLGLRAVSAEGLDALGRQNVQGIFSGDQRSDFGWGYYLLLMDFDLTRLENRPTPGIGKVITRLADAELVYDIDPARRFGVCRPNRDEFQSLERATIFGDSAKICELFEKWSAAAKSVRINSWRTHFDVAPTSFSAAKAELTRGLRQKNDVCRRVEVFAALSAYCAAGAESVITKFAKAIDGARDPFEQVELMAAAGYAEIFFATDPLVRAAEAVLAGQTPPSPLELQEEMFERRQQCLIEVRRICRDRRGKR